MRKDDMTIGKHPVNRRAFLATASALSAGFASPSARNVVARQARVEPTLLVRGEDEFSADANVAWRIVRDVAEVAPNAAFETRATGFAVATNPFNSLLLTDEATGSTYRLAHGEAAFVRDGTTQRRESLGRGADSYLRIGLVEASLAEDAGGDRLIFAGPAFTIPAGPVTLALQRAEMTTGDVVGLPPGAGDTLVLVEQGEVELEIGEAAPRERLQTVVGSDTYYVARSVGPAAMLYCVRDATRVLLATIE
jgi:hypothetical protein